MVVGQSILRFVNLVCVCIVAAIVGVVPSITEQSCSLLNLIPTVFGLSSTYMFNTRPVVYSQKRKKRKSIS
jgi:preprotein translocase subunit SecF